MDTQPIKIAVVIPTYNNATTIGAVVDSVKHYSTTIIVVNDGSTDTTASILALRTDVDVVMISNNSGKGVALKHGFDRARALGYTHAITIDADGQHVANDIPLFIDNIHKNPEALFIGERLLDAGGIPQPVRSRFGRRFGAFWYKFFTDFRIPDTQCGFRAYPLKTIVPLKCTTTRYEYEIEVLIKAAWNGIEVVSFPIHLLYHPKNEAVSHFRPIRDFIRISKVNAKAALIKIFMPTMAIDAPGKTFKQKLIGLVKHELRAHATPKKAALSLALGVFLGILPIHGLQMIVILGICAIFPVNRPLAFLGVAVSAPPFLPFIILAGLAIGRMMVPAQSVLWPALVLAHPWWLRAVQWFIGSIALAIVAGAATFGIAYALISQFAKKPDAS